MKTYKCHKTVKAARVVDVYGNTLVLEKGEEFLLTESQKTKFSAMAKEAGFNIEEGYVVQYENNYVSWSPDDVFEAGYTELKELSQEEMVYRNIEGYLRAAIIELANIEDSNVNVIAGLARMIESMHYAICSSSEIEKCGL